MGQVPGVASLRSRKKQWWITPGSVFQSDSPGSFPTNIDRSKHRHHLPRFSTRQMKTVALRKRVSSFVRVQDLLPGAIGMMRAHAFHRAPFRCAHRRSVAQQISGHHGICGSTSAPGLRRAGAHVQLPPAVALDQVPCGSLMYRVSSTGPGETQLAAA